MLRTTGVRAYPHFLIFLHVISVTYMAGGGRSPLWAVCTAAALRTCGYCTHNLLAGHQPEMRGSLRSTFSLIS